MPRLFAGSAALVVALVMACDLEAQVRAPYGSGTGVNSLGIKTNNQPRVTRNYVVRQPGYFGYGYRSTFYGYGPVVVGYGSFGCPYCGRWGCRGFCYRGPVYLPPVVADAGLIYGPRATQRMLFGDPVPAVVRPNVVINNNPPAAPAANPAPNPIGPAPAPEIRPAPNREVRARAWRRIEAGDRNFREGDFRDALAHYRKSTEIDKQVAGGYFRTAFAMLALGRWTEATLSIERGLLLKPDWPDSGFVLEELYTTPAAKRSEFRKLQIAKQQTPHNADVRFMLGVMLHFDGQAEAAEVEFRRVVELTGQGDHALAFLPPSQEPAQLPAAAPPIEE